jgi:hypothetical protein
MALEARTYVERGNKVFALPWWVWSVLILLLFCDSRDGDLVFLMLFQTNFGCYKRQYILLQFSLGCTSQQLLVICVGGAYSAVAAECTPGTSMCCFCSLWHRLHDRPPLSIDHPCKTSDDLLILYPSPTFVGSRIFKLHFDIRLFVLLHCCVL